MSYFNITILGCGSATPTTRHNPSAQAVRYRNKLMLVDCAEGTQLQMRRYGLSFAKVSDIFISHLHGDHFLGLPGLLSTMSLHNVEGTVTVHTFTEGADILKRLMNLFCRDHSFNIEYDIIDPENPGVTEGMLLHILVADALPSSAVASLGSRVSFVTFIALGFHLGVFLTETTVS